MSEQKIATRILVRVPDDLVEGVYANFMQVTFTQTEFIITFARLVPERTEGDAAEARAVARIVIPHVLMPKVIDALSVNVHRLKEVLVEEPIPSESTLRSP